MVKPRFDYVWLILHSLPHRGGGCSAEIVGLRPEAQSGSRCCLFKALMPGFSVAWTTFQWMLAD